MYELTITVECDNEAHAKYVLGEMEEAAGKANASLVSSNYEEV